MQNMPHVPRLKIFSKKTSIVYQNFIPGHGGLVVTEYLLWGTYRRICLAQPMEDEACEIQLQERTAFLQLV